MKYILVVIVGVTLCGVGFAETSFEVKDGIAIITETAVNQPVQYRSNDGKTVNIPGTTRDITTKINVTKEQAQLQVVQLNAQRANMVSQKNSEIANIDAQIKLLKDIDAALPEITN